MLTKRHRISTSVNGCIIIRRLRMEFRHPCGVAFCSCLEATKTYDARYLIGNYYSYNAAAAGSGGEELSSGNADNVTNTQELNALLKNAPDSICPKGWQLPRSGANYTTKAPFDLDDSYYRLLLAYGYPTSDKYGLPGVPGYTSIIKNQNKNVSEAPFYWVRSGVANLQMGILGSAGQDTNNWFNGSLVGTLRERNGGQGRLGVS